MMTMTLNWLCIYIAKIMCDTFWHRIWSTVVHNDWVENYCTKRNLIFSLSPTKVIKLQDHDRQTFLSLLSKHIIYPTLLVFWTELYPFHKKDK